MRSTSFDEPDPWQMTAVTLVALAAPTVTTAWTTLDLTGKVPPGTRAAVLRVRVCGTRAASGSTYAANELDVRRDPNSPLAGIVTWEFANPTTTAGVGGCISQQVTVPLTPLLTFQYQYTVGLTASNNAQVDLIGYIGPQFPAT